MRNLAGVNNAVRPFFVYVSLFASKRNGSATAGLLAQANGYYNLIFSYWFLAVNSGRMICEYKHCFGIDE